MTPAASRSARSMRVVHVVYSTFPFDPRVHRVVEAQRAWNAHVHVVALQEAGQAQVEREGTVTVHRVPLEPVRGGRVRYAFQYALFLLAAAWLVFGIRIRGRVDVVHVHSLPDFLVASAAPAKLLGARLVLDLHEAMPEIVRARFHLGPRSPLVALAKALEWGSCALADAVLTATDSIRDLLSRRGTPASKMTVIMNSPRTTKPRAAGLGGLRSSLGLNGHRPIVYVGGLNAERDLGLLIRAVSGLHMEPPLRLVMFGYGSDDYRASLRRIALEAGVPDFTLGPRLPQDEVSTYLALSDLGVVTYERNPLTELAVPNKVFEYVAVGKPLILARLRTMQTLFGDAALYYEPGDADDLREKMRYLFEHPSEAHRLAERASAVLDACRWEVMEERLRGVYGALLRSGDG